MSDVAQKPTSGHRADISERLDYYDDDSAAMRAMLALDAGRMGSWSWDIPAGTVAGDPFVAYLLNLDPDAQPWPLESVFASMHPDDLDRVQAAVAKALDGADIYDVEFRDRVIDPKTGAEGLRWLGARGRVTERGPEGEALQMIGVNWDATAQKTQEERLSVLAAEMDHRVKNAFAVMRAMINIGMATDITKESFADTLKSQIEAMATAHSLSAKMARSAEDPNVRVELAQIFETALAPWIDDGRGQQVQLDCARDIVLSPKQVSSLSMLLYELVTNAVKYGALSSRAGKLAVFVVVEDGALALNWRESGAQDKALTDGDFTGFGSLLIDHCVRTLMGTFQRDFPDGNLQISLRFPLV